MPYQSDPVSRAKINAGTMGYMDVHLSHVAQMVWEGFFGQLDTALVEVAAHHRGRQPDPVSSVGNNKTWLDLADRVILEVNAWQPLELEGMHDIYYGTALRPTASRSHPRPSGSDRRPVPAVRPGEDRRDRRDRRAGPQHAIHNRRTRLRADRRPCARLPGPRSHARAASAQPAAACSRASATSPTPCWRARDGRFERLTAYTEVIQDGMLDLLRSGTLAAASATAFSLSEAAVDDLQCEHRSSTASGSSCDRRRSATTPRSSDDLAAWP